MSSPAETIKYNWCIYSKNPGGSYGEWFCTWSADYKKGVSFALSSLPVLKSRNYEALGLGTQILAGFEVIVLSSQFALLLLAVRRRFKR